MAEFLAAWAQTLATMEHNGMPHWALVVLQAWAVLFPILLLYAIPGAVLELLRLRRARKPPTP